MCLALPSLIAKSSSHANDYLDNILELVNLDVCGCEVMRMGSIVSIQYGVAGVQFQKSRSHTGKLLWV